ncbi:MAG: hypothetical protein ACREMJ_10390 [Gemmatimonadales bacterium]
MLDHSAEASVPERRYVIERRVLPDRRSGLDQRIGPRRFEIRWVETERRARADRRAPVERRSPMPRRSWFERRGSGLSWVEPFPP